LGADTKPVAVGKRRGARDGLAMQVHSIAGSEVVNHGLLSLDPNAGVLPRNQGVIQSDLTIRAPPHECISLG
jgi:hypothetical protein